LTKVTRKDVSCAGIGCDLTHCLMNYTIFKINGFRYVNFLGYIASKGSQLHYIERSLVDEGGYFLIYAECDATVLHTLETYYAAIIIM
jgi:hypothetical protein